MARYYDVTFVGTMKFGFSSVLGSPERFLRLAALPYLFTAAPLLYLANQMQVGRPDGGMGTWAKLIFAVALFMFTVSWIRSVADVDGGGNRHTATFIALVKFVILEFLALIAIVVVMSMAIPGFATLPGQVALMSGSLGKAVLFGLNLAFVAFTLMLSFIPVAAAVGDGLTVIQCLEAGWTRVPVLLCTAVAVEFALGMVQGVVIVTLLNMHVTLPVLFLVVWTVWFVMWAVQVSMVTHQYLYAR